jgi:hypothetical protein
LNYYLLTVLPGERKQELFDLTHPDNDENVPPLPRLPSLNLSQGIGNYYVDLIIEQELKNEGRKKRNEEIKSEQKTKQQKVEQLKKITKVSSTQLASNNLYTLDETVWDMVFERNATIVGAQVAVEQRKQAAESKKTEALNAALKKFDLCPNGLTVSGTISSDSPVKKKKEELQQQLYREPRYSRVKLLAQDLWRTMIASTAADAAEALVSLFAPAPNVSAQEAPAQTAV